MTIVPLVDITAILAGPAFAVDINNTFEINITVAHNSSQAAHNLILTLQYPAQFVLAPDNFTYNFSLGGGSGVDGELVDIFEH